MQINSKNSLTATERILQFIDYKGITKYQFHKKNGFSNGFLDKSRAIGTDKCEKILEQYPEINPTWLLTGKGPMLLEEPATAPPEKAPVYKGVGTGPPPTVIEINPTAAKANTLIADVHASAGFGSLMESKTALEQLPAIHLPKAPPGLNVAFQVDGDSMHPTIRHLDFVAGNRIDPALVRDGHTYIIVDREEGVLCKRLYHLGDDWQIVSDNPIYKPYNRSKEYILYFFKAFCRWSYDFRNYHDDVRADIQQLKADVQQLKKHGIGP